MKNLLFSTILFLVVAPCASAQVRPTVFTLENGMKFILLERSEEKNSVAVGWVAKVGSVNERPGITGISHFFEHLMFKGTNKIGYPSIVLSLLRFGDRIQVVKRRLVHHSL